MQDTNTRKIKGIAARMGNWSATHRKLAIWGWLAFLFIAVFAGQKIAANELKGSDQYAGESAKAEKTLEEAFPQPAGEMILVHSKQDTVDDSSFKAAVADVTRRMENTAEVKSVKDPYVTGGDVISEDRHSVLVTVDIKGDAEKAVDQVDPIVAQVEAAQRENRDFRIESFGTSADKELEALFMNDLKKAGMLSLPVTLLILMVVFGSMMAAGVPLLLALSAVLATMGLVNIPSQLIPIDQGASEVILLIGLAVGVDYSLFYMRREREERAAGHDPQTALQRAAATSGRAVLVSGLTVMAAMAGMFFSGDKSFMGLGLGAMLVVAVAMVGSLTVLPATIAWLGDRVEKGRLPFLRRKRGAGESRMWTAIIDRVLRRPVVSAVAATAVLVALAIPALHMKTTEMGASDLPQGIPVMETYDRIEKAFPNEDNQAVVVISSDTDLTNPKAAEAIADLEREALATGQMHNTIEVDYSKDRTVAQVSIPIDGQYTDASALAALDTLRNDVIPNTVGNLSGTDVNVSGDTASTVDSREQLSNAMPIVFGFVLTFAFLLLLVTFRSIVVPIKAIVLNLLSVGAAYGVLTFIFQDGHFESLLDFQSNGGVATWLPLFMFVVLFGLSMDYHVFILSRVREAVDRGMKTDDAVAYGIKSTASVVTSAAFVMVAVFSVFATLQIIDFKELGVGLAVAVFIDATIVRAVLLPASMKLLGERNWYLPRSLRWLPEMKLEGEVEPAKA
jgi:RND superfamily putative drug exporter